MAFLSSIRSFLVFRKNNYASWIETCILMVLFLSFCYWVSPENPLFMKEVFPWPWLAALIIVLQYGLGPGLLGSAFIAAILVYQRNYHYISFEEAQAYLLSGITLMLIASLFASSWARRMINAEVMETYHQERLDSLSRSFYMLKTSADFLEQNIITKPMTLRVALNDLQKMNIQSDGLSHEVCHSFLELLSQFCFINTAGFFLYKNGVLNEEPLSKIGRMLNLVSNDPLIIRAEELNDICYAGIHEIEKANECRYLVVVPLITDDGERFGLLVVQEMPFWSLNEETLRILNILVYYFMRDIIADDTIASFQKSYPTVNTDFARQLTRLVPLKKNMNMDSALVAIRVSKSLSSYQLIPQLKNQQRILDSIWIYDEDEFETLVALMPFSSMAGIQGYLMRMERFIRIDLGLYAFKKEDKIQMRSMLIEGTTPVKVMKKFIALIEGKNIG